MDLEERDRVIKASANTAHHLQVELPSTHKHPYIPRSKKKNKMHVLSLLLCASLATSQSVYKKRLTGEDKDTGHRWAVAGTDLGIPYTLENGATGFLFGDTFSTQSPDPANGGAQGWRSPVLLRSASQPGSKEGIVFDSAAGVPKDHDQPAPEIMYNGHNGPDHPGGSPITEVSVIPNDGISFPETNEQIVSYMSVRDWSSPWKTNYAGLAVSTDGNTFKRLDGAHWPNPSDNKDPFQMWTMQRDGKYVYVFSVRSGRQEGPMMLQRVPWDKIKDPKAYEGWGWNGKDWAWGRPCTAILYGTFGEPSVRKLTDGKWAMVYLNLQNGINIVSRTADGPDQPWSEEKIQVTMEQERNLYGGFIHPASSTKKDDLHIIVSRWSHQNEDGSGPTTHYHASQYQGSL